MKWFITGRCNLRCSHCFLSEYARQPDLQKILHFVDYFSERKVQAITLLGGEPLVRHDLERIVSYINERGIRTKIATNGMLISEERANDLVMSGNTEFQVSLESGDRVTNDRIRGANSFDHAIRGIRLLKAAGATVTVGLTLSQLNFNSFASIVPLIEALNVDVLRFEVFLPVGTGKLNRDFLLLSDMQLGQLKGRIAKLQLDSRVPIVSPFSGESCNGCSTLGCGAGTSNMIINSDFSVSACDLLVESDKTEFSIEYPEQLDAIWLDHTLFSKWRGLQNESALGDFTEVHQKGKCWLARSVYDHF